MIYSPKTKRVQALVVARINPINSIRNQSSKIFIWSGVGYFFLYVYFNRKYTRILIIRYWGYNYVLVLSVMIAPASQMRPHQLRFHMPIC